MKKIKLIAALILLAAIVVFSVQNLEAVEVKFLVWRTSLALAIPILGAFFIGGLAARPVLRFLNGQRRARAEDKRAEKAAAKAAKKQALGDSLG